MTSLLLLAAVVGPASAAYVPLRAPELRFSAEIPAAWQYSERDAVAEPKDQPDPESPLGIMVEIKDDPKSDVTAYLKDKSELSPLQLKMQGAKNFSAGLIGHQGPWTTIETTTQDDKPEPIKTLYAARPTPGGYYAATFFAREPQFSKSRPAFEHFLDTFKSWIPKADFLKYADPEGLFEVQAPSAPWTASPSPAEGVVRFIGPDGAPDEPRVMLAVRRFRPGGLYPDADAFLKEEGEGSSVQKIRLPAGEARVVEVASVIDDKDMPERKGPARLVHVRTRYAVFPGREGFYVLSYQAPATAYEDFLPVFRKFLSTFRLSR